LVTLGIIGIISALTIPSLIEKHREQVTVSKLKKMYSTLSNAYNIYINDESPEVVVLPYSSEGAEDAFKIFKPYLNIAKDCGANGAGCFYMKNYKWLNGSTVYANYGTNNLYYKVLLADGASIAFRGLSDYGNPQCQMSIFYDVNGTGAPNIRGKDMFEFQVINNTVVPTGTLEKDFQQDCLAESANGVHCTAWVIFNENLDYLHCKNLSWNGATSCKK